MSETIVVDAVSEKFANKYNSGSIKVGDKWYQVSSKLDINKFKKGATLDVNLKTNDKGYTSVVSFAGDTDAIKEAVNQAREKAKKPESKKSVKTPKADTTRSIKEEQETTDKLYYIRNGFGHPMSQYEIDLDRRISRAGIIQAVAQSPALASLPATNTDEVVKLIKEVSLALIDFVEEK